MKQIFYALFTSILFISAQNTIAMHDQPRALQCGNKKYIVPSMIDGIKRASLTPDQRNFNVSTFKAFITQWGTIICQQDLVTAYIHTHTMLKTDGSYENQETILALRDYTAAMIAINQAIPGRFDENLILNNMAYVRAYYENNNLNRNDSSSSSILHALEHRWGKCPCPRLAHCNWPALE